MDATTRAEMLRPMRSNFASSASIRPIGQSDGDQSFRRWKRLRHSVDELWATEGERVPIALFRAAGAMTVPTT